MSVFNEVYPLIASNQLQAAAEKYVALMHCSAAEAMAQVVAARESYLSTFKKNKNKKKAKGG